ncbi:hypothetical protein PSP31120_02609 [Pandoraea sputorum]|nr:hypothetical protein PSP31120_02609 [Pandoraea sputorum]
MFYVYCMQWIAADRRNLRSFLDVPGIVVPHFFDNKRFMDPSYMSGPNA